MDSSLTADTAEAVKGLAVLAAIPVVLFALWADYFGRYLKNARKTSPGFDPRIERERVRVAAACVLLFELILAMGSLGTLEHYPKSAALGLLACLFTTGLIQAGIDRQLTPVSLSPLSAQALAQDTSVQQTLAQRQAAAKRNAATGARALMLAVLSGLLYMVTLICFVKVAAWISTGFHFSTAWSAAFMMAGAAAGIFFGLCINFALAPWQMRHSLPVTAMTEEERAAIRAPMESAGLSGFSCWVVEERHAMAAIAGFRWGKGIFRPALFISRTVIGTLSSEEITAVVAHEAAHSLARHLRKRVLLAASLIVSLTFLAVFLSLAAFTYFPGSGTQGSLGMIFGMGAFTLAFLILQKQNRVHEFEADWIAIQKLGASFESWAAALRKMDQMNGYSTRGGMFSTHPRTEIRIQNVAKMLEYFAISRKAQAAQSAQAEPKAGAKAGNDGDRAA